MEDDLFAIERLDNNRILCISSLGRKTVIDAEVAHLGVDSGFFIYEVDESRSSGGIQILAKVASMDAAYRLIDIWKSRSPLLGAR